VGAGPSGSAAAYFLAARGARVMLVDKASFPRDKACGDALTPCAIAALQEIGVLPDLLRTGQRIAGIEVVAPDGSATTAPVPAPGGLPVPMLVVPRVALDNAIRERALRSGAGFAGGVHVGDIDRDGAGVIVRGTSHERPVAFAAPVAIVATGASVALLRRMRVLARTPEMMLAARAYVNGITGPSDRVQVRFDGVPLPGYGWIFPVSGSSANVGIGGVAGPAGLGRVGPPPAALRSFLRRLSHLGALGGGRPETPPKGYPLRVDFPHAPTSAERVLLVGEAAGLANPLTGEGIDYALESGRIAADHAVRMLEAGDLSQARFEEYGRALRARFERLFAFCRWLRGWSLRPPLVNRLVRAASRHTELRTLLLQIVLGSRAVPETPPSSAVLRGLLARLS